MAFAVSPISKWDTATSIAYIAADLSKGYPAADPVLKLLTLPSGEIKEVGPLANPDSDRQRLSDFGATLAMGGTVVWSHDGSRIAFISALDAEHTDVFTYAPNTGELVRLTTLAASAAKIVWSPDDEYILYGSYGALPNHSTGHYEIWATKSDGIGAATLLQAQSPIPIVYDWFDDQNVVLGDVGASGFPSTIRIVNVVTGSATALVEGDFFAPPYNKSDRVFLLPQIKDNCADANRELLYLSGARRVVPVQACGNFGGWIEDADSFVILPTKPSDTYHEISDGTLALVSQDGDVTTLANPFPTASVGANVSPDGKYVAWEVSGGMGQQASPIWVSEGTSNFKNLLTTEEWYISAVTWTPDSQTLFFSAENSDYDAYLFKASAPNFDVVEILSPQTLLYPVGGGQWVP